MKFYPCYSVNIVNISQYQKAFPKFHEINPSEHCFLRFASSVDNLLVDSMNPLVSYRAYNEHHF